MEHQIQKPGPALTEAVYYILLSLVKPMHGYGIMQNVEKISEGRLRLAAGTVYGALAALAEKGWITALSRENEERRRLYQITPEGIRALYGELFRLEELIGNGIRILKDCSAAEADEDSRPEN